MEDVVLQYILRAIVYSFKAASQFLRAIGTGDWPRTEATVTAEPVASQGLGCRTAEYPYSYRVDGELYTGLHEEPFLLAGSLTDYVARFSNGRTFMVRIKPNQPETSVVRERDQAMQTTQCDVGDSRR